MLHSVNCTYSNIILTVEMLKNEVEEHFEINTSMFTKLDVAEEAEL